MISVFQQPYTRRMVGWLVCACLLLKPVLLFEHVLTEAHCFAFELGGDSAGHGGHLARIGIEPHGHGHGHGAHSHEDHGHEGEGREAGESGTPDHDGHPPHPIEEHLAVLAGDPANTRGHSWPDPGFAELALDSMPRSAHLAPVEWRYRSSGPEEAWNRRVDDDPPHSRGPPVV